jgi:hypothetical protein
VFVLGSFLAMRSIVKAQPQPIPSSTVTTNDLLELVNGLRTAHGLPALTINSILMSTAQSTAQQMADQNLTWHIGSTSDRIKAAGYGGSATVWATENFATYREDASIDWIQQVWADDWHMIPMTNPIYCDLGAGVATAADGTTYYVVHAAYTSRRYCGEYIGPGGITLPTIQALTQEAGGPTPEYVPTEIASNWIEPVITVTPNSDGELVHEVKYGQNLWTIATIYETSVELIKQLNNMTWDTVYVGNRLLIPTPAYFALTPSATPSPTNKDVDPVTIATQSTEQARNTQTPTPTRTLPPSEAIAIKNETVDNGQNGTSMGSMVMIVFAIAAVVVVISFLQPWKSKPESKEEDPLTTRVE